MLEVLKDVGLIYVLGVLWSYDENEPLAHAIVWPITLAKKAYAHVKE